MDIPGNFLLMNYYRVYGMHEYAKRRYGELEQGKSVWLHNVRIEGKPASGCLQCHECETKCPQNIPIVEQLEQVAETMAQK